MRARLLTCMTAVAIAAVSYADVNVVAYRCKVGQAPQQLATTPQPPAPESLEGLVQWDRFAVRSISRAVKGGTRLETVLPMFRTLMLSGPFAGTFAGEKATPDAFLGVRATRFLDAGARLAAGPPIDLLRTLLADAGLVAELQKDSSGAARRGGDYVFTRYLKVDGSPMTCAPFLPALLVSRNGLSDRDLVGRCMLQVDRGSVNSDMADLLSRTFLWDMRLYLLSRPEDADPAAALAMPDEALAADFTRRVSAAHLRYFLFGARESKAAQDLWEAFDADSFIDQRPDFAWVGHAAALAYELTTGTVISVSGEFAPRLGATGATAPLTYTIGPAQAVTYATLQDEKIRLSDLPDKASWVTPPQAVQHQPPIEGDPTPSGATCTVSFTGAGERHLTVPYTLYGLELPPVMQRVDVAAARSKAGDTANPDAAPLPEPVIVELTIPPSGYQPVATDTGPLGPGERPVINAVRRFVEFADGQHGMEHLIVYEVLAATQDIFPAEITYADPNPRGDTAVRERAIKEAERIVREPLGPRFQLTPRPGRVFGRDCWVGRKGQGPDGRFYYVLCRGRQTYLKVNEAFVYQRFWDPLIGEQSIYDTRQTQADTVAVAESVLRMLQAAGPGGAPSPTGAVSAAEATGYLAQVRDILKQDADLASYSDLIVAAWRQKRLNGEDAATQVRNEIIDGYDALATRATGLRMAGDELASVHESLMALIGVGSASSRLLEKGVRNGDDEKISRGMKLLHSYDSSRKQLQTRAVALGLEYAKSGAAGGVDR